MADDGGADDEPTRAQRLAAALVDELARAGLTDAVVAPGARSAPLALALEADRRIAVHVRLDERGAGYTAVGLAMASGRPAAVVTTSGTGAAGLHPAVLEADRARLPLLALTADRPGELHACQANQTVDQHALFGPATRWAATLPEPPDEPAAERAWRSLACQALAAAFGPPAGPAHLDVPLREPLVAGDAAEALRLAAAGGRGDGRPWAETHAPALAPDRAALDRLADRLAGRRGVVVVGRRTAAPEAAAELAEQAGWPLIAEAHTGARRGPNALRCGAWLAGHAPLDDALAAEVVVQLGAPTLFRDLSGLVARAGLRAVVDEPGEPADPWRSADVVVTADPAQVAGGLAARLADAAAPPDHLEAWLAADRAAADVVDAHAASGRPQTAELATARSVLDALPSGAALLAGSSTPVRDVDLIARPDPDRHVLASRGVSGVDGLVATAGGLAGAWPGPVAALLGDLAVVHDASSLLAADPPAPLAVVVVDNDGGGVFHRLPGLPDRQGFERVVATPHGADLGGLARAGGWAVRDGLEPAEAGPALAEALRGGGRWLLRVPTDRRAAGEAAAALHAAALERAEQAVGR